jgi:hypothetical protein
MPSRTIENYVLIRLPHVKTGMQWNWQLNADIIIHRVVYFTILYSKRVVFKRLRHSFPAVFSPLCSSRQWLHHFPLCAPSRPVRGTREPPCRRESQWRRRRWRRRPRAQGRPRRDPSDGRKVHPLHGVGGGGDVKEEPRFQQKGLIIALAVLLLVHVVHRMSFIPSPLMLIVRNRSELRGGYPPFVKKEGPPYPFV